MGPEPFGTGPGLAPQEEAATEASERTRRAPASRVVILSDSQAIDRRGRLIDITGLEAVRIIGRDSRWVVPLDSVEGGNDFVLMGLGGEGCDPGGTNGNGSGNGNGPQGGGGEQQMVAGMEIMTFQGDTIECCEGEHEIVIEGECQCPDHLIEDEELGCICENLQDPEDYCHSEPWSYHFSIEAPCSSCVAAFYDQFGPIGWACPDSCFEPDPPPGGGSGGNEPTKPTLICDESVTRGETGGCELTGLPSGWPQSIPDGPVDHAEWTFSPHPIQPWPAGPEISDPNVLPTVDSLNDPTGEWKGTLVASGAVSVTVTVEDSIFHLGPEELSVQDRAGGFSATPVQWQGERNKAHDLDWEEWAQYERGGANVNRANGSAELDSILIGGAEIDTVNAGPNSGYAYVSSTDFRLDRSWVLSKALYSPPDTAPAYLTHAGVSWSHYDLSCLLFEGCSKFNALVAGVASHEQYGGVGPNPGHMTRFEWILDPSAVRSERSCASVRPIIERIVGTKVAEEVDIARVLAWRSIWAASSHQFVHDHYQNAAAIIGQGTTFAQVNPIDDPQTNDMIPGPPTPPAPPELNTHCDWGSFSP